MQTYKIGKLFAKHIRLEEQEAALGARPMPVAVGTPNRLLKLADSGHLRLDRLKFIVLDVHLDAKQRCALMVGIGCGRPQCQRAAR